MHAFHVPFGGHAMSLNQGLLLTLAARGSRGRRIEALGVVLGISGVAAALKPLSPAGNRLGPMLAIFVQGWLYGLGLALLGANVLGAALGLAVSSLWGFAQPLILGYLIFGRRLFEAIQGLWIDAARSLGVDESLGWKVLAGVVLAKLALAVGVAILGWLADEKLERRYLDFLQRWTPKSLRPAPRAGQSPAWGAVRDLSNRWYVASLVLTLGFLYWSGRSSTEEAAWFCLRALAAGWLIFWVVRKIPILIQSPGVKGRLKRFPTLLRAFETASKRVVP